MKVSASSNYPAEKTTIVTAKNSSVPKYQENKTTFVSAVKPVSTQYPLHKTAQVVLKNTGFASAAATPALKKEEVISKNYSSQKTTEENKTADAGTIKPVSTQYPMHKTARVVLKNAVFVSTAATPVLKKEEIISQNYSSQKTTKVLFKAAPVSTVSQAENLKKEGMEDYQPQKTVPVVLKTTDIPQQAAIPAGPAKKASGIKEPGKATPEIRKRQPAMLVLTTLTAIFILSSGALSWIYWQQNKQMELLIADQQRLEEIAGLKVDDVIGGGLKSNDKFALTTNELADTKFIRVCFSAAGNQYASAGKKTFFVRLVNPESKDISLNDRHTINVNGKTIECTLMREVNYEGAELFICEDIEKPDGLIKGNYKIEVYSNGALKGESNFELK